MASKKNELTAFDKLALAIRASNDEAKQSNKETVQANSVTAEKMSKVGKAATASAKAAGTGLKFISKKLPGAKLVMGTYKLFASSEDKIQKKKAKAAQNAFRLQLGLTKSEFAKKSASAKLLSSQKDQVKALTEAAKSLNMTDDEIKNLAAITALQTKINEEENKLKGKDNKEDKGGKEEQSGAKASEDATELRILNDNMLSEQEKQTSLLQRLVDAREDAKKDAEKSSGGIFGSIGKMGKTIMTAVSAIGASLLTLTGLPALKKLIFGPKVDKPLKTPKVPKNVPTVGRDAKGRFTKLPAKPPVKPPVGLGSMAKKFGLVALRGLKLVPVVGQIAMAVTGLYDGITAGMREAENENATGLSIAREATAGVLSGISFGFIEQETISKGMTGIADSVSGMASSVKTKITDIGVSATEKFNEAKDSAIALGLSVKNKMVDIGASATEKFNEAKDSAIALGLSVKDKITSIPIPTFAEASESLYNLGTGFATAIGIPVPTFDDAKASLTAMGTSLTAGFTSLFGDEDGSFSFESVSKGVTGLAGGYFQKITDIWNSITDIFPSWEGIKKMLPSPKKILSMLTFGLLDDDEKFDAGDYISRSEVKSLVASAVTKALQEQSMMNSTAAANAPFMFMQGANQTTTSVNNITKPIMIPTPPSNPNDSWWNVSNLF